MQVDLKTPNNALSHVVRGTLKLSLSTDSLSTIDRRNLSVSRPASSLSVRTQSGLPLNDVSRWVSTISVNNIRDSLSLAPPPSDVSADNVSVNSAWFANASDTSSNVSNNAPNNNVSLSSSSDVSFNNSSKSGNSKSAHSSIRTTFSNDNTTIIATRTPTINEVLEDEEEQQPLLNITSPLVTNSGSEAPIAHAQHSFNVEQVSISFANKFPADKAIFRKTHAVLQRIVFPRTTWPTIRFVFMKMRLRLAREVFLLGGMNGTRRKVGLTMWITTRVRPPGWIQDDRPLSVSRTRTVRVLLYILRLIRNSVHCHLGGKCDLYPQPVCISLTTIPRRQRGMTHGCRHRSTQMCRSISAISAES